MFQHSGNVHNACDVDISNRRKIFLNTSTWVQCTISNGHIAQVLFLSKGSINSNDQGMRVELSDKPGAFFEIQGMYRVGERSVDKDPRTFVGMKQMSYIWA